MSDKPVERSSRKAETRDRKRRPKMRVTGKSVFKLKDLKNKRT